MGDVRWCYTKGEMVTTIVGRWEMVLHKEGDGDYHSGEL